MAGTAGSLRVLRGGSFLNNERNARAAYRNRNNPHNRNRNNGVRVGVAAAHSSQERSGSPEMSPGYGLATEALRESAACPWPQSRACGPAGSGEYRIAPAPGFCPWVGALFSSLGTTEALNEDEDTEGWSVLSVVFSDSVVPISASASRAWREGERRASLCLNSHFPLYYPQQQAGRAPP